MMGRMRGLLIANTLLFVVFIVQAVTGVSMLAGRYDLPGVQSHGVTGVLMMVAVVVHLSFNWGWLTSAFRKKHGTATGRR